MLRNVSPPATASGRRVPIESPVADRAVVGSPAVAGAGRGEATHRLVAGGEARESQITRDSRRRDATNHSVLCGTRSVADGSEEVVAPTVRFAGSGEAARSQTAGDDALKGQSAGYGDGDSARVAGAIAKLASIPESPTVSGAGRRKTAGEVAAGDDALERQARRARCRREVLVLRAIAERAVGAEAPAVDRPARRHSTDVRVADGDALEGEPSGNRRRGRMRSRRAVTELSVVVIAPAVGGARRGQSARDVIDLGDRQRLKGNASPAGRPMSVSGPTGRRRLAPRRIPSSTPRRRV